MALPLYNSYIAIRPHRDKMWFCHRGNFILRVDLSVTMTVELVAIIIV